MSDINKAYCIILIGILICLISSGYVYISRAQNQYDVTHSKEINKKLDHYYLYENHKSRGRTYYSTIMVFLDGSKFYTDLVSADSAEVIFKEPASNIVFYANPASTVPRKDGAIKCYGLWVNGNQISTPNHDLEIENGALWILLAFCLFAGIILIVGGLKQKIKASTERNNVRVNEQTIAERSTARTGVSKENLKEHTRYKLLKITSLISDSFYLVIIIILIVLFILSKVKVNYFLEHSLLAMFMVIMTTLFSSLLIEAILTGEVSMGGSTYKKNESTYLYYIALSIYVPIILFLIFGALVNLVLLM